MNLYRINPCFAFLRALADFIVKNFSLTANNLKVILPSGTACDYLQKILVEKLGATFLPTAVAFHDILAQEEEIPTISSLDVEQLSDVEQKLILAEIIQSFDKLNLNTTQALKFVPPLTNLLQEFICNNIPIAAIKNLSTVNHAEHWHFIYEFLNYAYDNLQNKLSELKKVDRSTYKIKMLEAEVARLKSDDNSFIVVAGIFGCDQSSWNFIKNIASSKRGFVILPPVPNIDDKLINNCTNSSDPLYCLNQLLKYLNKKLSDFKPLNTEGQTSKFDNLIIANKDTKIINAKGNTTTANATDKSIIEYYECADIVTEAEIISLLCRKYSNKKTAIVVNNEQSKEFYSNFLLKNNIKLQDCLGNNLSKTHISQLIINTSELLYREFALTKLFVLLKNPIVNCSYVIKLEQLLSNKNRFISEISAITDLVSKTQETSFINWWQPLAAIFKEKYQKNDNFNMMLMRSISVAEQICPDIWQGSYGAEISQFFAELMRFKVNLTLKDIQDFPAILQNLLTKARAYDKTCAANIIMCKPKDAVLLKFDLVILTDCSDGNWPALGSVSPWLNRQMQNKLELHADQLTLALSLYYFYLLIHNQQVIITRSIKQLTNTNLIISPYIMKLLSIAPEAIKICNYQDLHASLTATKSTNSLTAVMEDITSSTFFPNELSVTDIEMLMRSPYSFYAKKILNLKKYESITTGPKLSEFGSFIHKVFELYARNYNKLSTDKLQRIIYLSEQILSSMPLPLSTKKIWKIKFGAMAAEFIEFDEATRSNNINTYCEIRGKMQLKVANNIITITAIADRIEVNKYGAAIVIDYKTGALPLKKEVLNGFSPQLILEALILLKGGFNMQVKTIEKLMYVKIASSKPYIQTLAIKISREELDKHLTGLEKLLEHYLNIKAFPKAINCLKYNDYLHLSRKI